MLSLSRPKYRNPSSFGIYNPLQGPHSISSHIPAHVTGCLSLFLQLNDIK